MIDVLRAYYAINPLLVLSISIGCRSLLLSLEGLPPPLARGCSVNSLKNLCQIRLTVLREMRNVSATFTIAPGKYPVAILPPRLTTSSTIFEGQR